MARRKPPTSKLEEPDADLLRRRFRQLELRLCIACGDGHDEVAQVRAVGEQLRRDAAKSDDPAERLALAERAYLSVFTCLPSELERIT